MTGRMIVTGCQGFIGLSVAMRAVEDGWTVLGLGRGDSDPSPWPGRYRQCDVATDDLAPVLSRFRPDVVVHAAGSASVDASFLNPTADFRGSVLTWMNLLEGARRSTADPLVIGLSSAAVYGQPRELPITEDSPRHPISPYGHHRSMCEELAREYARCFSTRCLVARVFSVIGPRQRRLLAYDLAGQALGPEPCIQIRGTGKESRDFLHVDDLARGLVGLARAEEACASVEVVNIASGVETSVSDLAELVNDLTGHGKEVRYMGREMRGSPVRWAADISLLRALLPSWSPRTPRETMAACLGEWRQR